jgi:hypothetical protein
MVIPLANRSVPLANRPVNNPVTQDIPVTYFVISVNEV